MKLGPLWLRRQDNGGDEWELSSRRGRLILHGLALAGTVISQAAAMWAGGDVSFFASLMVAVAIGHLVSNWPGGRGLRLSVLIYPAALAAAWFMRGDLTVVLVGGSLFPLAKLLAILQAMTSFNLRSLRSMYDSMLLSLLVILLASERAPSASFVVVLLAFSVVGLAFLASAHPIGEALRLRWGARSGASSMAGYVVSVVVLTLASSRAVFLAMPQGYQVLDARPLPSRLDVTRGRPVPPTERPAGDPAPWAQFLPSRGAGGPTPAAAVSTAAPASSQLGTNGGASPPQVDSSDPVLEPTSYVDLGYQGEQGDDAVMYVRSRLASYWRGIALDEYDGRGWKASGSVLPLAVSRRGILRFSDAPPRQRSSGYYAQYYFPKVTQPDVLFTGYSPGFVALGPAAAGLPRGASVAKAIERLHEVGSYRVISAVPNLTPDELREDFADRRFQRLLALPSVPERVRELALGIVATEPTDYDKAAALEHYLITSYTYDLRVPPLSRSQDAVDAFLFERQSGFCAQFATAMAVMARAVGLPARVVTGYVPGEFSSLTGGHTVRLQDAHAWVEVRFRRHGWVPFDPTPRPDSPWALDSGYVGATRGLQTVLRARLGDVLSLGPTAAAEAMATLTGEYGALTVGGALFGLALGVLALAGAVLSRRKRNSRLEGVYGYSTLEGAERAEVRQSYGGALRVLKKKGYPERGGDQSPEDYLSHLLRIRLGVPEAFRRITRQASRALYDPRALAEGEGLDVKTNLKELGKTVRVRREREDEA